MIPFGRQNGGKRLLTNSLRACRIALSANLPYSLARNTMKRFASQFADIALNNWKKMWKFANANNERNESDEPARRKPTAGDRMRSAAGYNGKPG
jgi:hypothetical protein